VYFTDIVLSLEMPTHCQESTGLYQIICICLPSTIFDLLQYSLNSGLIKKYLKYVPLQHNTAYISMNKKLNADKGE